MRKTALVVIAALLVLPILVSGCSREAARKPVPNADKTKVDFMKDGADVVKRNNTVTRKPTNPVSSANSASEARKIADKLTNAAVTIDGVKSATVVVQPMNNRYTALVGINLRSDITGKKTTAIKKEVAKKIKATDNRVTNVLVTSDPDLVKRIADIARGIIAGKPIRSFADEISELTRRIGPTI